MRGFTVGLLSVVAIAVSGCSLMAPNSTSTPKVELTGAAWIAEDVDGAGVIDDAQSTLEFGTDGKVSGRGGCNRYGGSVSLSGASMIVGELFSTKMACVPALMDQETKFLAALQATRSYRMDDTKLVLVDATGKARLRFSR
ncbi:MAG: META domain-containing protein [Gammaproteobacteria bacterium]